MGTKGACLAAAPDDREETTVKNRREQILETARRLFVERGYDGVSVRDIAKELGISAGNITYYFKKKEDLMEASVLEQSQNYHLPVTPANLVELDRLFAYICQEIMDRLYYFHHYTQMSQISPRVHALQQAYTKELYLTLKHAFLYLQETGDMEKDIFPGELEHFVQGLMIAMTYWAPHNSLLEEGCRQGKEDFMGCLWGLMLPRLTQQGKEKWKRKIWKQAGKTGR